MSTRLAVAANESWKPARKSASGTNSAAPMSATSMACPPEARRLRRTAPKPIASATMARSVASDGAMIIV